MFYGILMGVGSTGADVWRRLALFDVAQFFVQFYDGKIQILKKSRFDSLTCFYQRLEEFLESKLPPRGFKSTERAAHTRPRVPKTSATGPQITHKNIFTSESSFYQTYTFYCRKMKVFEGVRVRLGARNRHREAPRQGKQRSGRRRRNKSNTNP